MLPLHDPYARPSWVSRACAAAVDWYIDNEERVTRIGVCLLTWVLTTGVLLLGASGAGLLQ